MGTEEALPLLLLYRLVSELRHFQKGAGTKAMALRRDLRSADGRRRADEESRQMQAVQAAG